MSYNAHEEYLERKAAASLGLSYAEYCGYPEKAEPEYNPDDAREEAAEYDRDKRGNEPDKTEEDKQ